MINRFVLRSLPLALMAWLFLARPASAACGDLTADANLVSAKTKSVQAYEKSGDETLAKTAWNSMNHYALLGAEEFKACGDTQPRLLYAVSFGNATAVGMYFGLMPWSEGTRDIGGTLQIIDSLPHSPTVEKEWNLVDQLYVKTCGMHKAKCAPRTY